jgi:hypothetical protein
MEQWRTKEVEIYEYNNFKDLEDKSKDMGQSQH